MVDKYYIKDMDEFRGNKPKNKFKIRKDNTLKTLNEVEYFINNWKKVFKGVKIYKLLK